MTKKIITVLLTFFGLMFISNDIYQAGVLNEHLARHDSLIEVIDSINSDLAFERAKIKIIKGLGICG